MAAPVNLNRFRKAKARAGEKARAEANAAAFGRSKSDKAQGKATRDKAARKLDQHKRDP